MPKKVYSYKGITKTDTLDVVATLKNEINWIKDLRKQFWWKSYMKKKPDRETVYELLRKNIIALNKILKQLKRNENLN